MSFKVIFILVRNTHKSNILEHIISFNSTNGTSFKTWISHRRKGNYHWRGFLLIHVHIPKY